MTEKAIVLIDCGYFDKLNRYAQDKLGIKISFDKFSKKLTEGMIHLRTKVYHSPPYQPPNPTKKDIEKYSGFQKFIRAINMTPRHQFVKVGRVRPTRFHCPKCDKDYEEPKQKGVDVAIALDLVKMANDKMADVFILVCGDEDLSRAVEMAQENPCNVIVYFCQDSENNMFGSIKLNTVASDRVTMDLDFLKGCKLDDKK